MCSCRRLISQNFPGRWKAGVKVFRLTAEVVKTQLLPGKEIFGWGYNASVPGPTIEVNEGDRVRVLFENKLPEASTVHWHGLEVPLKMDGVPFISQPLVEPGGTFTYEFTLYQNGTFFYHSHMAMQEMMGMIGFFIIHPKEPYLPHCHKRLWTNPAGGGRSCQTTPCLPHHMMNQMVSMVGPMAHAGRGV